RTRRDDSERYRPREDGTTAHPGGLAHGRSGQPTVRAPRRRAAGATNVAIVETERSRLIRASRAPSERSRAVGHAKASGAGRALREQLHGAVARAARVDRREDRVREAADVQLAVEA